ncbi:unnamed protein product [Brachionus calyciflorus]|uniref:Uncharacterized protein n=1 Tax=Brachionus calyciflorus TaxID=104777 RepID=A0A814GG85_9BILA|nr:unnamed protein product [Brachionus calyciflorus]
MDFFITLTSGPTKDQPDNDTTWCEYRPQNPIRLDGDYEVALVQSIFKKVHSDCIATINIFPPTQNMEMFPLKLYANDGESVQEIIKNANVKLFEWSALQLGGQSTPNIVLNEDNFEFFLDVPEGWAYFVMDVVKNHIEDSYQKSNKTYFKFKNHKFNHLRHFYVKSSLVENKELGSSESPLLGSVYIKDMISNVNRADINTPHFVKVQIGSGLPYFQGSLYQKGYGLGGIFRRIFKYIMPIVRENAIPAVKTVGKELLKSAANVVNDSLSGHDLKSSAKRRLSESIKNISDRINPHEGEGLALRPNIKF